MKKWQVYLSGEIHSEWREPIRHAVEEQELPVELLSPQLVHEVSDRCGPAILGGEESSFWQDHQSARINMMAVKKMISDSDLVVVRFGEEYRQWNAAFEAGWAAALGKPLVTLHPEKLNHALKEINATAVASLREATQLTDLLRYWITGQLEF